MSAPNVVKTLYEQQVRPLSMAEQLELVALITRDLATATGIEELQEHSILELEGLGAEIWRGVDAQSYVEDLRKEWDHRP